MSLARGCCIHTVSMILIGYPVSSSVWSQSLGTSRLPACDSGSDDDAMQAAGEEEEEEGPMLETFTEAKYLLVVEKQGIFLRLCEDCFHRPV